MQRLARLCLWIIILLTAGLPLAWLIGALVVNPAVAWVHLAPDAYHAAIFARTLLLAAAGATLATLLAIPPAAVLARSGAAALLLLPLMAAVVAMPQPAWSYGWSEAMTQVFGLARPASMLDLARVAITNGAAWWPIPAAAIALSWRRLPSSILDAAALDGARRRMTARLLAGPALAGWSAALLLSAQNLSPPDQSGIVVASVIVRDTFQGTTTAFGSAGVSAASMGHAVLADQSARLAAAIAVGLPSFLVTAGLVLLGWRAFKRATDWASRESEEGDRIRARVRALSGGTLVSFRLRSSSGGTLAPSRAGRGWLRSEAKQPGEGGRASPLAVAIALLTILPPVVALLHTNAGFDLITTLEAHGRALSRGAGLALGAAGACGVVAVLGTIARPQFAIAVSLACFLLGGQFVALGMIRAFLPPAAAPDFMADALAQIYGRPAFHVAAYVALFAWLALAAGAVTWTGRWLAFRDLASADGASSVQTAWHVIWPLAWPGLVAATLAVFALAMTESQATALLVPGTVINYMLQNIHTQSYAPMAEAALLMMLLMGGAVLLAVLTVMLFARVRAKPSRGLDAQPANSPLARPLRSAIAVLLTSGFAIASISCETAAESPDHVWAESGAADGQLAYPRAITYSAADDTVWVVDKTARVQAFDAEGNFLRGWTMPEQRYGKPVGLSVDDDGNVWVADTHYYRVIVYRPDGTEWFRFGEKGIGPGQFNWPTDVLVQDDGRVLVSEYGSGGGDLHSNDRIQIFQRSEDGTISDASRQVIGQIGSFGTGEGQFRRPQSMAMVGDVLWVTDGANHRLLAFSLDGTPLKTIGGDAGGSAGQFRFPYGLDVDDEGNLLVSEFGNHRVQKIDPETGRSLALWGGSFGPRPGQVKYPWGVAWDSRHKRVILLDSGNDRIQVMQLREAPAVSR